MYKNQDSSSGLFPNNKTRIQKIKVIGDTWCICQKDKACFQNDIAYGDYKDVTRRTRF